MSYHFICSLNTHIYPYVLSCHHTYPHQMPIITSILVGETPFYHHVSQIQWFKLALNHHYIMGYLPLTNHISSYILLLAIFRDTTWICLRVQQENYRQSKWWIFVVFHWENQEITSNHIKQSQDDVHPLNIIKQTLDEVH